MALRKRNGTYHCDFMVNGQRYRQTLETGDRREAVQRERDLMAQAKQGSAGVRILVSFEYRIVDPNLPR